MRRFAGWVLTAVVVCVCGCSSVDRCRPVDVKEYDGPVRVACVGDSITYGSGIKNRDVNSYPAQLGRMLGAGWEVQNFGVGGATLLKKGNKPYWKQAAFAQSHDFGPDVVIIKLGTNDSKPRNWQYRDEFVSDYRELIESYRQENENVRVWIVKPVPVFAADTWGIRRDVVRDEVVPAVEQIGELENVCVIDLYTPMLGKGELFPDTVHPNATGAGVMAEVIFEAITGEAAKK